MSDLHYFFKRLFIIAWTFDEWLIYIIRNINERTSFGLRKFASIIFNKQKRKGCKYSIETLIKNSYFINIFKNWIIHYFFSIIAFFIAISITICRIIISFYLSDRACRLYKLHNLREEIAGYVPQEWKNERLY